MYNLIRKDFITVMINKGFTIGIITLVVFLLGILNTGILYNLLPIIITVLLVNSILNLESESENYTNSLPVKREDIIYSKYIMSIMILIGCILVVSLTSLIVFNKSYNMIVFEDIVKVINITLLIISIIIPLKIKFNKSNFKVIGYILMIGVVTSYYSVLNVITIKIESIANPNAYYKVGNGILNYIFINMNLKYFNFITLSMGTIIIFIVSLGISLKLYKSKEIK